MEAAKPITSVIVLGVLLLEAVQVLALSGDNVCTKQETYVDTAKVAYHKPYQVRTYTWCFAVPPRCTKYKIAYKVGYRNEAVKKTRTVEVCCKGYAASADGESCIPICSNDCIHGVCESPEKCKCLPGYGGPTCSISQIVHHRSTDNETSSASPAVFQTRTSATTDQQEDPPTDKYQNSPSSNAAREPGAKIGDHPHHHRHEGNKTVHVVVSLDKSSAGFLEDLGNLEAIVRAVGRHFHPNSSRVYRFQKQGNQGRSTNVTSLKGKVLKIDVAPLKPKNRPKVSAFDVDWKKAPKKRLVFLVDVSNDRRKSAPASNSTVTSPKNGNRTDSNEVIKLSLIDVAQTKNQEEATNGSSSSPVKLLMDIESGRGKIKASLVDVGSTAKKKKKTVIVDTTVKNVGDEDVSENFVDLNDHHVWPGAV